MIQHRWFELGGGWLDWPLEPKHKQHRGRVRGWRHGVWSEGPYVAAYGKGGGKAAVPEMQQAKRIDRSDDHLGLRDAIPPDYTQWLGAHPMRSVNARSKGRRTQ